MCIRDSSREADNGLYTCFNSCSQYIVGTKYIGLNSFQREELARRNLLEGCCVEDVIYSWHCVLARLEVTNITNEELKDVYKRQA